MKHKTLFWIAVLTGALSALAFLAATAAIASVPIIGGSSFGGAVLINPDTEYSASIDNITHKSDYFYFDAAPGKIVTMVFTSTTTFKSATFYLYDQNHVNYLAYQAVNGSELTYRFAYMGNNTTPTRYYFVVMSPGAGTNAYTFWYEVGAQTDGGSPGDAGDDNGTAKEITPGGDTTYANNLLGWADKFDWYKFSAASGQIVTMTLTYTAHDGASSIPTLTYTIYDQSRTTSLGTGSLYPPGGAPAVFRWMSNNTLPSAYYLLLQVNTINRPLTHYALRVQSSQQQDAGQAGDAGDASGTARVITPGASTTYANNLLGRTDVDDWYRINAVSGQIITASIIYNAYEATSGYPLLYYNILDQTGTHSLANGSISQPSLTPVVYHWISNNTEPSAYLFHLSVVSGKDLVHYSLQVQLDQQVDAGQPGDAGDNFETARVVTLSPQAPTLNATRNLFGGSDSADYYLVKLPPVPPPEPPVRYGFWIAPVSWPSGSGYLSAALYDAQRNLLSSLGGTINAPSINMLYDEITICGSDGCYVKVTTGFTGYYQLQYRILFTPIRFIYLPLTMK